MGVFEKYSPWIEKNLKHLILAMDRLTTAALRNKSTILMDAYRHQVIGSLLLMST